MSLPPFTNLASLAEQLDKNGQSPALRSALNQAWRVQSCLGDLRQAEDCCTILAEILKRPQSHDTGEWLTVERALLSTAINLYVRATSTSGQKDERGSIQLHESKLSIEQNADHRAIVSVRNQAMAHVYNAQDLSGAMWHRNIFFAFEAKSGHWKPASASNQMSFHHPTFERLLRMCPVATRLLTEKFHKRMLAVTKLVNNAATQAMLHEHSFDPIKVFGSEKAVQALIDSSKQASASFWVNE